MTSLYFKEKSFSHQNSRSNIFPLPWIFPNLTHACDCLRFKLQLATRFLNRVELDHSENRDPYAKTLSIALGIAVEATALSTAVFTMIQIVVDRCPTATTRQQFDLLFAAPVCHVLQTSLKHNLILSNALTSLGSLRIGKLCFGNH